MFRRALAIVVLTFACTPFARSQTPPSPAPVRDDCACESQVLPDTVAVVNGVQITSSDIKKSTADAVEQLHRQVVEARKRELDLMINSKLLSLEAKQRSLTTVKLLEQEVVAKVTRPTQAEAQRFYDQNKTRIQGEFKDVAENIVAYLFEQRQQAEAKKFADALRAAGDVKVNVTAVTPPANAAERARVFATIKGEKITSGDVEDSLLALISDVQQQVYKLRKEALELNINDLLLTQEAQKRKITTNALLDAEAKPKPVTDEQIQVFYDQNKERVSGDFTQTKDAIRRYLEQTELRQAELAFVTRLRANASIQVFLAAPESRTAAPNATSPKVGAASTTPG